LFNGSTIEELSCFRITIGSPDIPCDAFESISFHKLISSSTLILKKLKLTLDCLITSDLYMFWNEFKTNLFESISLIDDLAENEEKCLLNIFVKSWVSVIIKLSLISVSGHLLPLLSDLIFIGDW
jgi:hypothetical protein